MTAVSSRDSQSGLVTLNQLEDRMGVLVVANQTLASEREKETILEQARIIDTQVSIQQSSTSNSGLGTQLISLQSQIKTNATTLTTETKAERDLEKAEFDSLERKKGQVQELSKKIGDFEKELLELERRVNLQELANKNGYTPEIEREIYRIAWANW
jgi:uncharacterized protein YbcI